MKKWTLIIDVARCHDCNNCFLACKDEFCDNDHLPYSVSQPRHGHRWMNIQRTERGHYPRVDVAYLAQPCMHCDQPLCIDAADNGAIYIRDDGIVIIDPVKAKGQKQLVNACPYQAIWWNETLQVPQKCTLCAHLLDNGWKMPRCVQACPTGALSAEFLDDDALEHCQLNEQLEVYQPQHQTRPRVFYKSLFRYTKCIVAGTVALKDVDECAAGAEVTVSGNTKRILFNSTTNTFGDFKFDNLVADGERLSLKLTYPGYRTWEIDFLMEGNIDLGTILLAKTTSAK